MLLGAVVTLAAWIGAGGGEIGEPPASGLGVEIALGALTLAGALVALVLVRRGRARAAAGEAIAALPPLANVVFLLVHGIGGDRSPLYWLPNLAAAGALAVGAAWALRSGRPRLE